MPMEQDLFVGVEFDDEIDDIFFLIDKEDRGHEMLEVSEFTPLNITVVKAIRWSLGLHLS
jgi:hypothetical protein